MKGSVIMPSNKETLFQDHICKFLEREHGYHALDTAQLPEKTHHIIEPLLLDFIKSTQAEQYAQLVENYGSGADTEIIKALKDALSRKLLWLIMRDGLDVRGTGFKLYYPKPRSTISPTQLANYQQNHFSYKKEYYYNNKTQERIDLVIWLNGLPIIVIELKHEDEGQNVDDAIYESFLKRDFGNTLYTYPFLYVAASDVEVKVATNPQLDTNFRWFNAALVNKAETEGEYPIEHLYRDALSKDSILKYLEHFLVFVPASEGIDADGVITKKSSFTIFPRYHQLRVSKELAGDVRKHVNANHELGLKYLVNHSAGSGKTLTMVWMADQLDSLYDDQDQKMFDNIIILTDRKSLDKNINDELKNFVHLKTKVRIAKRSRDLANHLDKNRAIIVSTIHKFGYIQEKMQNSAELKSRKIAFLIDEAHRSQEGKMALNMRQFFTEDGEPTDDLQALNISNQVFVAFTATTTPKTVAYFGEPFDVYSEEEAIEEGYILDVAQNIIAYETMYNLKLKQAIPEKDYPAGVVAQALRNVAYTDEALIQYKSEVIVKLFLENVADSIEMRGKAMVVASSRPAGLMFFKTIKTIFEAKYLPYKVLFAFSDYTDENNQSIEEVKVNALDTLNIGEHKPALIEDVFDTDEYRILVVANKFQTGFDQPLLSAMFLDKAVNGVNAVQTVSRLNRMHVDKAQDDILVVDFTNNSDRIFKAFNQHRKGSPYEEKEPDVSSLVEVYQQVMDAHVFDAAEITAYVEAYGAAEKAARNRESELDASLSNINQEYKAKFNQTITDMDKRKAYVSLLNRYTKVYYFIAQFFELDNHLHEFVVFAEVMAGQLIKTGKTSELKLLMKHIEVSKGAVNFKGSIENKGKAPKKSGGGNGGGGEIPRTSIEQAIQDIEDKYQISKEDAIIIREICEEVSENEEVKERVSKNKDNILFLESYEPTVQAEVKTGYMGRDLWDRLEDPMYIEKGGIITIMSKSIIQNIAFAQAA